MSLQWKPKLPPHGQPPPSPLSKPEPAGKKSEWPKQVRPANKPSDGPLFGTASGKSCAPAEATKIVESFCNETTYDSFTLAEYKRKGLFQVESDTEKGHRAAVQLLGIGLPKEEVWSDWLPTQDDAKQQAALQAVKNLYKRGLLNDDLRPVGVATAAAGGIVPASGGWLVGLGRSTAAVEDMSVPVAASPDQFGAATTWLWQDKDLADPRNPWPDSMLVFRMRVTLSHGSENCNFGILAVPPAKACTHFGLSLEWWPDSRERGIARFEPYTVASSELLQEYGSQSDAKELLRRYHECVIYDLLPGRQPECLDITAAKLPTPALVVRLLPMATPTDPTAAAARPRLAWPEMSQLVATKRVQAVHQLLHCPPSELGGVPDTAHPGAAQDGDEDDAAATAAGVAMTAAKAAVPVVASRALDLFTEPRAAACDTNASGRCSDEQLEVPDWLASLLHRWFRLYDLQAVGLNHSPIFPVLSPLLLEAAVALPSTRLLGLPFDVLWAYGSKVLQLLQRITLHMKHPYADQADLVQKAEELLPRERLAELVSKTLIPALIDSEDFELCNWMPPGVWCRPSIEGDAAAPTPTKTLPGGKMETFARVAEAFVGAYALSEGGFYSAWQFCEWLQGRPHEGEGSEPSIEEAVLGHLVFGDVPLFKGNTPRYVEFQEVPGDQANQKRLRVKFEAHGWAEYLRPAQGRRSPLERFPDMQSSDWRPVGHSIARQAFVSPHLRAEDESRMNEPVPSKIARWLTGKPAIGCPEYSGPLLKRRPIR